MKEKIPNNLDALHDDFKNGRTVSFIIPKKRAKPLLAQFQRIYNAEKYFNDRSKFGWVVKAFIYAFYVELRGVFLSIGCRDIERALLVFQTSWRLLAPIEGEDLPDGMAKVTFRGK